MDAFQATAGDRQRHYSADVPRHRSDGRRSAWYEQYEQCSLRSLMKPCPRGTALAGRPAPGTGHARPTLTGCEVVDGSAIQGVAVAAGVSIVVVLHASQVARRQEALPEALPVSGTQSHSCARNVGAGP